MYSECKPSMKGPVKLIHWVKITWTTDNLVVCSFNQLSWFVDNGCK